jgi:hypothetical protein
MKKSNVSLDNLMDQLSEEKINLIVDKAAIQAGQSSHTSKSKSSNCNSSSSSSCRTDNGNGLSFGLD